MVNFKPLKLPNCQFKVFRENSLTSSRERETHARNLQDNIKGRAAGPPKDGLDRTPRPQNGKRNFLEGSGDSDSDSAGSSGASVVVIPNNALQPTKIACTGRRCFKKGPMGLANNAALESIYGGSPPIQPDEEYPDCEISREISS